MNGGEAEARSGGLGGVEGFEDVLHGRCVHSDAGVADRDHDVAAGLGGLIWVGTAVVDIDVLGGDGERAAGGRASRALMARLRMTCSNWPGSEQMWPISGSARMTKAMLSRIRWRSNSRIWLTISLGFNTTG
jgi:hypothetical protein